MKSLINPRQNSIVRLVHFEIPQVGIDLLPPVFARKLPHIQTGVEKCWSSSSNIKRQIGQTGLCVQLERRYIRCTSVYIYTYPAASAYMTWLHRCSAVRGKLLTRPCSRRRRRHEDDWQEIDSWCLNINNLYVRASASPYKTRVVLSDGGATCFVFIRREAHGAIVFFPPFFASPRPRRSSLRARRQRFHAKQSAYIRAAWVSLITAIFASWSACTHG